MSSRFTSRIRQALRYSAWLLATSLVLTSCLSPGILPFGPNRPKSSTVLASSSLRQMAAYAIRNDGAKPASGSLRTTPINVTGKIMSAFFTIDDQDDEGVVVFGNSRPDIADVSSELFDFNMRQSLAVSGTLSLKQDMIGGITSQMALAFGFVDVELSLDGNTHGIRIAMADVNGMKRGDKLLKNADGTFQWFDMETQVFSSVRPPHPAKIAKIADYYDPGHPKMVFFPLSLKLKTPLKVDANRLKAATEFNLAIDFEMQDAIELEGVTQETGLDSKKLIQSLEFSQDFQANSGFTANATMSY